MLLFLPVFVVLGVVLANFYWRNLSKTARLAANIPGPKPLPLIGSGHEFGSTTVDFLKNFVRLWREYGYTYKVWLGPYLIVITGEAKYAEHILNSNTNLSKSLIYKLTEQWLGKGLLTSTGDKWRHRRKMITPTFHFKILDEFIDVFNANGKVLVKKLKEKAGGEAFDIYNYITLCALDSILETAMGVKLNVQNNTNSEYVSAIKGMADVIMKRTFTPWIYPNFIFYMTELGKRQKECLKILHGTTKSVIASKKKKLEESNGVGNEQLQENDVGQKKRLAFLDLLLQYNKEGANLTDEEIREEVDTFMFEGHDTTSSAISFCLLLLANHPEIQEKVYEEQQNIFDNFDGDATMKDLHNMKYLECVIKETLRIYPSVPFIGRRLDEDISIDGFSLSRGTSLLVSPFLMNRNPEYFPEPEKFNPDRFSADNVQGRNPFAYVPFSAGPRNCIGQKFAMLEIKSIVSEVVRNFKLLPSSDKLVLTAELVLRSEGGIVLKLENRKRQ